MEGYDVVGSDDHKVGHVVAVEGDLLIVEGGTLRKTRHAIPTAFTHADDAEQVVRLSIAKELVDDSPKRLVTESTSRRTRSSWLTRSTAWRGGSSPPGRKRRI